MELLKGKVAMVTGGTRGIGYAIVKTYLENGASEALCGSRQETVDKALAQLKAENPDYPVIGLCPDLGNPEEVAAAVAQTKEALAMAADELISITQVQASFVIGEAEGVSHISARSHGEVNVQMILEKLGGGGHQTMAGAQVKASAHEAALLLKAAIDSYIDNN